MSFTEFALKLFHLGEGPPDQSSRFAAIGRDLPRVDGRTKVIGTATYAAEWPVETSCTERSSTPRFEVLNIPDPHMSELGAHGVGEMGNDRRSSRHRQRCHQCNGPSAPLASLHSR